MELLKNQINASIASQTLAENYNIDTDEIEDLKKIYVLMRVYLKHTGALDNNGYLKK